MISNAMMTTDNPNLDFNGMMAALRNDVIKAPSRKPGTQLKNRFSVNVLMRRRHGISPTAGRAGTGALSDEVVPASVMQEAYFNMISPKLNILPAQS